MTGNNIGVRGAKLMTKMLETNKTLTSLDLGGEEEEKRRERKGGMMNE